MSKNFFNSVDAMDQDQDNEDITVNNDTVHHEDRSEDPKKLKRSSIFDTFNHHTGKSSLNSSNNSSQEPTVWYS